MSIILIAFNDHTGGAGHGDDDGHDDDLGWCDYDDLRQYDDDDDLGWCDDGSTGRSEVGLVRTSLQQSNGSSLTSSAAM